MGSSQIKVQGHVTSAFLCFIEKKNNTNNNRINSLRQICTIRRAISLPNKAKKKQKKQHNLATRIA